MSPDHREIVLDRGGAIEDPRGQICRGFDEIAVVSIAPPETTTTKVFRQRPKSVLLDDDGDIEKDDDDDD
jgi:hypothetical protein